MKRTNRGTIGVALGAVVSLAVAACGGGGSSSTSTSAAPAAKGGTLTMLNLGPTEHLDPQRVYLGADILMGSRVFARSLTTFAPNDKDAKPVPDLATDTGQILDDGKTWKFTLKDGVKWQDGKDITCADLKYGISRTFATDVITGGPNYILAFLDIPAGADGSSQYKGPYTKVGQDLFDKAVTCDGKTITYRFNKPWKDFNQATAGLLAFAPFRQDQDKGAQSDLAVFSTGPYMLEGAFDKDKGGKFVRNPNWSESTDPIRKAYPDVIQYVNGVQTETIYQRLIADQGDDKTAISAVQAAPSSLPQIESNAGAKGRSVLVNTPYVDYIQPNMKSPVFTNPKARQALAMATSRDAYSTAYGGKSIMDPTYSMCSKLLRCYKEFNPFGAPTSGDTAGAKKVLQDAGLTLPVPVTVVYRKRPTADKALQALKEQWDAAGFNVTLEGVTDKYYATIQGPAYANRDAFWAGWGADWPSGSTIMPALFDGRVNISAGGAGQDYGYFNDDEVNAAIDKAFLIADDAAREKAWADIDEMIAKKGGSVAMGQQKFTFMWGSSVKNFSSNPSMAAYPDLALVAVK
ncbi:MAG: ABC transporter substrate-binding protein [Dermatophilaceae bacterium]